MKPCILVALLCVLVGSSASQAQIQSLAPDHPKAFVAAGVYERLVAAVGDARTPPALRLVPEAAARSLQIAWYSPQAHTVYLEERVYDLCVRQGADSLAAMAVLLGHELAHFYENHDWAGDFGNGFADLQVGRQLRQAHRQRGLEYEAQADVFGGYYGYAAGFNTLGVAPPLLVQIYQTFGLDEELPGYPALGERQDICRRSEQRLQQLVPVFDAAGHLLVIGEYELAAAAFDWLARDFPSREILNNAGVALALEALDALPPGQVRFALPFELDATTRLQQRGAPARGQTTVDRAHRLLQRAGERFDSARRRDPNYAPALVNLAAVHWLAGRTHACLAQVDAAMEMTPASDGDPSRTGALLMRGICSADSDSLQAAADFQAALVDAPEFARRNLAVLNRAELSPERRRPSDAGQSDGPREVPLGKGSETYQAILAEPQVVELTGVHVESESAPMVLYRDLGDRRGFLIDTSGRSITLLEASGGSRGATARGIAAGAPAAQVRERYGEAARVVRGADATWWVYDRSGTVFELRHGAVAAWLQYHAEAAGDVIEVAAVPDFGPRVALVIGNDGYAEAPLRNAVNDAVAMSRALRAAGFEVIQEVDADRRAMADAIRRFGERLQRKGGVGLFYYAGHGVQIDGVNYLLPVAGDIAHADEVVDESVAVDRVVQKMTSAGNDVNILFLDACRNNPYSGTRSGGTGLAPLNARGTFVAYATQPGKVAADAASDGHGVFTGALLKHLLVPGQSITELAYAVRNDVSLATGGGQFPLVENGLSAEFFFVPAGTAAGPLGYAPRVDQAAAVESVPVSEFGFRIDRYEVTNRAFAAFLNDRGNRVEDGVAWLDESDADAAIELVDGAFVVRPGFADHPAVEVSWYGAQRFCQWRGAVLPTAEQWERAAHGADTNAGAAPGNFRRGVARDGTVPVGMTEAGVGPYGTHDMAGNVWEWVADADGTRRLILGGSWFNVPEASRRDWIDAAQPNELTGFRCLTPGLSSGP